MNQGKQRLLSYVPAPLRRSASVARASPWSERLVGAVVFADVSGFTALTERAAAEGPQGAEQLSNLLYSVFGRIATLIHDHYGDVIEYAGDAVIAFFPSTEDHIDQAVSNAAICALALPETLRSAGNQNGVDLSMRIGIASGALLAASLGGASGRRMYMVGGAPIEAAANACEQAVPNEVIVDAAAASRIDRDATLTRKTDCAARLIACQASAADAGNRDAKSSEDVLEAISCYVPRSIDQRIGKLQTQWLAEFRHVSVLFAAIDGIDYSHSNTLKTLQSVALTLQNSTYRHEGDVLQLLADDKGTVLLATWGLPGYTHEDDARRAVDAALEIIEETNQSGIPVRIGIARGRVFCGERGGDQRRDYAMLGKTVNLAARLMQKAKGAVLCDEATVHACKTSHSFESAAEIQIKGFDRPIAISRPISAQKKQLPNTAIVFGRTDEKARLERIVSEPRGRHAIILEGEAGIGKSALLGHVIDAARQLEVRCLTGIADVNAQSTPFYAWRSVLVETLKIAKHGSIEEPLDFGQIFQDNPELDAHSSLLGMVLGIDVTEPAQTQQLTAMRRGEIARDLVVHLIGSLAKDGAVLLVFDDLHWLDSASWALLRAVFERVDDIRIVMAMRPVGDVVNDDAAELRQSSEVDCTALQPLAGKDVLKLVAQQLGVDTLPAKLTEFVQEKSGGNPFFAEELISALREEEHLTVDGGECRVTLDLDSLDVPVTVQGVVAGRIDRLPPEIQFTMKVASVVGRVFEYRTVHSIHPIIDQRSDISRHLKELESLDLTVLESPVPDLSYMFRHAITQEVTYDLLSFAQRRTLHATVAGWYEDNHGDHLSAFYPLLAQHWARADDANRAVNYYQLAGEQAMSTYANREAVRLFGEADALANRDDTDVSVQEQSRWHWLSGRAYLQLADNASSRRHLLRSLDLIDQAAPSSLVGRIFKLIEQLVRLVLGRPLDHRRSPATSAERPALIQAAGIHHDLGEIAYFDNDLLGLAYSAVRAVNLAEATGDSAVVARSYTTACVAVANSGLDQLARRYRERAVSAAKRTDDLAARAYSFMGCGLYHSGLGEWQMLDELVIDAIEIFERIGDRYRWEMTTNQRAFALLHQGYFARAAGLLDAALGSSAADDTLQVPVIAVSGIVLCDLATANPEPLLLERLKLLARQADEMAQPSDSILAYGVLALAALRENRLDDAKAAAERAVRRFKVAPPPSFYTYRSIAAIAEVAIADCVHARSTTGYSSAGRCDRIASTRIKQLARFAGYFRIAKPRLERLSGHLALLKGKPQVARAHFEASVAASDILEMPYEKALAQLDLAQLDPDAGEMHTRSAVVSLRALGVAADRAIRDSEANARPQQSR